MSAHLKMCIKSEEAFREHLEKSRSASKQGLEEGQAESGLGKSLILVLTGVTGLCHFLYLTTTV